MPVYNMLPHSGGGTLLWTNSSPNSPFSAQTLSLDLSGYTAVIIGYKRAIEGTQPYGLNGEVYGYYPVGKTGFMQHAYYQLTWRTADITTTGITFSNGYFTTQMNQPPANDAYMCVPTAIYGIK